jgi:hypothetical protein
MTDQVKPAGEGKEPEKNSAEKNSAEKNSAKPKAKAPQQPIYPLAMPPVAPLAMPPVAPLAAGQTPEGAEPPKPGQWVSGFATRAILNANKGMEIKRHKNGAGQLPPPVFGALRSCTTRALQYVRLWPEQDPACLWMFPCEKSDEGALKLNRSGNTAQVALGLGLFQFNLSCPAGYRMVFPVKKAKHAEHGWGLCLDVAGRFFVPGDDGDDEEETEEEGKDKGK